MLQLLLTLKALCWGSQRNYYCQLITSLLSSRTVYYIISHLEQVKLTIVGVYAPNNHPMEFWNSFCPRLLKNVQGEVILLRDFNTVIFCNLNRSKLTKTPGIASIFLRRMKDLE